MPEGGYDASMAPDDPFSRSALLAAPAGFIYESRVRFQDVDAAGIVFFARLFDLMHDAYVAFLAHHGIALDEVIRSGSYAVPLSHADANFLRPLRFGDQVATGPVRAKWEGSRITIGHRISLLGSGQVVALGRTAHVFVDSATFQKIAPPPSFRRAFGSMEVGSEDSASETSVIPRS
jgi:1,4-dihydroxy-2-naphthoyl-CoA hydrolase